MAPASGRRTALRATSRSPCSPTTASRSPRADGRRRPRRRPRPPGRSGYPVVMKTDEPAIAHKSDVGGVVLGSPSPRRSAAAYDDLAARLGPRVRGGGHRARRGRARPRPGARPPPRPPGGGGRRRCAGRAVGRPGRSACPRWTTDGRTSGSAGWGGGAARRRPGGWSHRPTCDAAGTCGRISSQCWPSSWAMRSTRSTSILFGADPGGVASTSSTRSERRREHRLRAKGRLTLSGSVGTVRSGNGRAMGSGVRRLRPCSSKRSRPSGPTSIDESVVPSSDQVGGGPGDSRVPTSSRGRRPRPRRHPHRAVGSGTGPRMGRWSGVKSIVAAQTRRRPSDRGHRHQFGQPLPHLLQVRPVDLEWPRRAARRGCSSRTEARPPRAASRGRPATSKTMGTRDGSSSGCGSVTATWWRTPAGRDPGAGAASDGGQLGAAGQHDRARWRSSPLVSTPVTRPPRSPGRRTRRARGPRPRRGRATV